MSTGLTIGKVSKQAGISVGAVRYYESLGLLTSERGQNGYRYYDPIAVKQVQFIKKAQTLGFSLNDIHDILTVHKQGNLPCDFVQALLQKKIEHLEQQIHQMQVFKAELESYRDSWQQLPSQKGEICPLIETVKAEV